MNQISGGISGPCPTGQALLHGLGAPRGDPGRNDFTIADVLAWARTKPAGEEYRYTDSKNCALCHFLRDTGRAVKPSVASGRWSDLGVRHNYSYDEFEPILQDWDGLRDGRQDWTFGGIVRRIEALAPETIIPPSEWTRLDAYLCDIDQVSA